MGPSRAGLAALVLVALVCGKGLGVVAQCRCEDKEPRGTDSCVKQKEFGNCEKSWVLDGDYCAKTCNRCSCDEAASSNDCSNCNNSAPTTEYTCEQQKIFGKCDEEWMADFCQVTCGRCVCNDVNPQAAREDAMEDVVPSPSMIQVPRMEKNRSTSTAQPPVASPRSQVAAPPLSDENTSSQTPGNGIVTIDTSVPPRLTAYPEQNGQTCSKTLLDVLQEGQGFSTLRSVLDATGIARTLDNSAALLSLFAPDDRAFARFFDDFRITLEELVTIYIDKAEALAKYHIVPDVKDPATVTTSVEPLPTLLRSKKLFAAGKSTIESLASTAKILSNAIPVCGSYVFIIDNVLLPAPSLAGIGSQPTVPRPAGRPAVQSLPSSLPVVAPVPQQQPLLQSPVVPGPSPCSKDGSLAETLKADPELQIMSKALEVTGLMKKYLAAWDDEITVFAPTDAAFEEVLTQLQLSQNQLFSKKKQLSAMLKYHMVSGNVDGANITQGSLKTLHSKPLFIEVLDSSIEVAGLGSSARILELDADQQCHGALHKIDRVLLPFALVSGAGGRERLHRPLADSTNAVTAAPIGVQDQDCPSVAEVLASNPNLRILSQAIKSSGMQQRLADRRQSITFFAPTNEAFLGLSKSARHLPILDDPTALLAILGYHALSQSVEFDDLKPGSSFRTMVLRENDPVEISIVEDASEPLGIVVKGVVGMASIRRRDILACDSIIHIIDGVLLPAEDVDDLGSAVEGHGIKIGSG